MKHIILHRSIVSGLFVGFFSLLFSSALLASAENDFNLGVSAFKTADYAAAIEYFESAHKQGIDSMPLYYNLASSYYKAGQYEQAKTYYQRVAGFEGMRDLAEYNLGLVALKQNDLAQAKKHFTSVVRISQEDKLLVLAKKQLSRFKKKEDRSIAFLSLNYGYDDNPTSAPDGSASNDSDTFYDLYFSIDGLLSGTRKQGWLLDAYLYRIDYSDSDAYNEDQLSLGLKKTFMLSDWESSARFSLADSNYAGEDYLSLVKLDLRGKKYLGKTERLYLRYRFDDISSDQDVYDYLAGWRQRMRVEFRDYQNDSTSQMYYELELNDRGELTTTSYSYDYSPTRHTLRGKYTHFLSDSWRLSGDLSYRYSIFPSSSSIHRKDSLLKLAFGAEYRIDKTLKLEGKLETSSNDSTASQYDYDRQLIKFGLSKSF
jgi:hypothetical protein